MKDYLILQHADPIKLAQTVKSYLVAGWTLQGGVSVAIAIGGKIVFAQALGR